MVRGSQARSTAGAQESALEMELAPAGGPLQRAMRLSHQHFPTESLSNMLRPLGLADGHALHDVFNLVTLPLLVYECCRYLSRGDRFDEFLLITYGYFVADLLWVMINPSCVKSPGVIITHHICTMLYILLPVFYLELRAYMAVCLLVEVNTFFLILRRIWHVPPVSVAFYVSWIGIRLIAYPYLIYEFALLYVAKARQGHYVHPMILAPTFQTVFTLLNVKWTVDLVNRKLEDMRSGKRGGGSKGL